MPIIVLLSESSKKRPFQRFHAVQRLAFAAVFWSLMAFMGIGSAIISIIPLLGVLIGFMVVFCVVPIAWFASVVMLFYYGVQAYKGRRFAIPGLTSFLQDQGWL